MASTIFWVVPCRTDGFIVANKRLFRKGSDDGSVTAFKAKAPAVSSAPVVHELDDLMAEVAAALVADQVATAAQVERATRDHQRTGRGLVLTLLESGVPANGVAECVSRVAGWPMVDLRRTVPEVDTTSRVSEPLARRLRAVPLDLTESGSVRVAVVEPMPGLVSSLEMAIGAPVDLCVAPYSDVTWALDSAYRSDDAIGKLVATFETIEGSRRRADVAEPELLSEDAPVVQVVNEILTQAMRDRASDVHIEPSDDSVRVRFRIDGALKEIMTLPASIGPSLVSRIKIMANMNIVERRRPQDGQLTVTIDGRSVDVRVATVATIMGENCVMRILDKTRSVLKLKDLGMPADSYETFAKLVRAPFGMVLCAGPTGSGKTTTLYATLGEIRDESLNVMTIEDPVEYVFPAINQIQTNEQAGLTFATGLKSILRQDPDVILVGEVRDVETTRVAVQSALTGHFVVSSLHATDSVSALHRMLDMGIESFLVASSVLAVVGQRLLRRICPSCIEAYEPSDEERLFYEESGGAPKTKFFRGAGCGFCSHTGYKDRIGVYELLVMTPEIRRLVVGWATQEELRNMAVKQGMRTLRQEAISLVSQDVTTLAEVIRSMYTL